MEEDDVERRSRRRQRGLEPLALLGVGRISVRLVLVAVESEEMDRPTDEIVIAFVARKGEVAEIGLEIAAVPILIAGDGEKEVRLRARAERSFVRRDEVVEVLADVAIDARAVGIV